MYYSSGVHEVKSGLQLGWTVSTDETIDIDIDIDNDHR
jgi:hypothetical protein